LPKIVLNAPGGTVTGSLEVDPNVRIVNNSNLNVVVEDISTAGVSGSGNAKINAATNSLNITVGPMPLTFENNSGSNVIFSGNITDPAGTLTVTNQGGSIFGTQGSKIQVGGATLDAPHGAIGSTGGDITCAACTSSDLQLAPLNLFLVPTIDTASGSTTLVPAQLSAVARNDIDLNLTPDATPLTANGVLAVSSVPLQLTNMIAGGDINLVLNPGIAMVSANGSTNQAQVNADYEIPTGDWVGAGGKVSAVLNGVSGATPSLTVNGALTSGFETIQFVANADGTFSSTVSAAGVSSSDLINYAQSVGSVLQLSDIDASRSGISITGTGNLGGSGTVAVLNGASDITIANHSNLVLSTNSIVNTGATGQVNIALNGTVSITPGTYGSPSGQINLSSDTTSIDLQKQLSTPNGTITVTSGADITGPSGVSLIEAKNIDLIAGGSIGPNLGVEMTQPQGILNAQAGGPITLTAISGDLSLGSVSSTTGGVTLTANQGSILNGDARSTANIAAGTVNLSAANGSIGTAGTALNLASTGTALIAAAGEDVNITAVSGTLNANRVTSTGGDVILAVNAGDLNLGYVGAVAGDARLSAYGSILNADQRSTSNVDAGNITLTARNGSIGTSAAALNINAGSSGGLVAAAQQGIYINQLTGTLNAEQVTSAAGSVTLNSLSGALNVTQLSAAKDVNLTSSASLTEQQVTSATGNITLTANGGDIDLSNVTAQTGDVFITASGSIVNASPTSQPNVFGRNLTLTASGGTIGSSAAELVTQSTGVLNALAASDIYLQQTGGDLNSQSIVSQHGSVDLVVANGNAYLQHIGAPQNVILLVNGNLLNIGLIDPADRIQIDLTGKGGVATIAQMFAARGGIDITADVTHIFRLFHTSSSNPVFFDITTTQGGFNQRPLDPGILLANSLATEEQRKRDKWLRLANRP
jgi:hypothetical protein